MNKYLKRIKDTVNKLNGTNPKKEYRLLDQIQEGTLLIRYQYELEKMDFSLDKESRGFQHIARYVRKMIKDTFGDWIFVSIDKYYLGAMWCSEKDKNDNLIT